MSSNTKRKEPFVTFPALLYLSPKEPGLSFISPTLFTFRPLDVPVPPQPPPHRCPVPTRRPARVVLHGASRTGGLGLDEDLGENIGAGLPHPSAKPFNLFKQYFCSFPSPRKRE